MNTIITENFILESMNYFPMGNFNPVLNRPYAVHVTGNAIDTIASRMVENKLGKVTPTILQGVASEIMVPSAVGMTTAVNSDWVSTRRYIFMLKVKTFDMMGVEFNSYIQGYTEYDGISPTGNIDGNMVHHINNVIETTVLNIPTPMGPVRKEKLYRIYNVFATQGQEDLYTQRPSDIMDNIQTMNMAKMMGGDGNMQIQGFNTANFINPYNQNTVASSADNNITTEYLSKILTTGILMNKSRDVHLDSYSVSEQSSVESKLPEPAISDNRFLKYISRLAGFKNAREVFNFNQLMQVDNTIYNRFMLYDLTKDIVDPVLQQTPEVGDFWHGQDPVTPKAYSLLENSVGMAVKYGFNKLYFSASNMTNPTGMAEIFITNFKSFINLEESDFNFLIEIFKEKFIQEIYLNESQMGRIPLHLEAYIDLLGTSKIYVQYAGYPGNWYTVPTFANSLFSQVTTASKGTFDYTSDQLNNVIDTLSNTQEIARNYY